MTTDLYDTLQKIAAVQAKRRKNWNGRTEPKDAALEAKHMQELNALRKQIQ